MKYAIDKQDHVAVIDLHEEKLDSRIAPALKGEFVLLNSEGFANIVLNLAEIKFADSSGLSALLVGNRLCSQKGGQFILYGITPMVQKVMEISQLTSVLNILPTREEALEAVVLGSLELQLEDELRAGHPHGQAIEDEEEEYELGGDEWEEADGAEGDDEWDEDFDEADEDELWDDDDQEEEADDGWDDDEAADEEDDD